MKKKPSNVTFVLSLLLLVVMTGLAVYWDTIPIALESERLAKVPTEIRYWFGTIAWLALASCFNRLTRDLIFEGWFPWRSGRAVPQLLQTVLGAIVYFLAIIAVIVFVFDRSPQFLLAATGGAGLIVGLALQAVIADFFAGLILTMQRPFSLGDYVTLGDQEGVVNDINWRATQLLDKQKQIVTIPNSNVTRSRIVNTTHAGAFCQTVMVTLGHDVVVSEAIDTLTRAATEAQPDTSHGQCDVSTQKIDKDGVTYRVSYWVPDIGVWAQFDRDVIGSIQKHLTGAGLNNAKGIWVRKSA